MRRGRVLAREVGQHRLALRDALLEVEPSSHFGRERLMGVRVEGESSGDAEPALASGDRPTGQHISELRNVALAVAGADAHRVQFENLARQILVEARLVVVPGERIGAERLLVVEKVQHDRMLFDGAQHVGESTEHMRANRLAFERAGASAADVALGDRNAEMVRPEGDKALHISDISRSRAREPRLRVRPEGLLFGQRVGKLRFAGFGRAHGHRRHRARHRRGRFRGGGKHQRGDIRFRHCHAG